MSCCGSKKTVKTTEQPHTTPAYTTSNPNNLYSNSTTQQYGNNTTSSKLATPASKINFSANGYEPQALNNTQQFVSTQKVVHYVHDRNDRLEDYSN